MRKLIAKLSEEQVQKDIVPLILQISNQEGFQWKVSALTLIRPSYTKAGKDKDKLRALYYKLCDDETPIIKRTAAKEFGPLCLVLNKDHVSNEMIPYYKKLMGESDIVQVTVLPGLVQLAKLFQNSEQQKTILQFVVSGSECRSWRVRNELAVIFPQITEYFGNQINELVLIFSNLLKDSENEVKISALKALNKIINKISADKINQYIIPSLRGLNNESCKEVKSNIGESFGPISRIIGYSSFNTNLGVVMDALMKDENAEVRLGIAKSMFDIFISSQGTLLSSTQSLLGTMQKDNQYRIRECVYETLAKLGVNYGNEVFKSNIEPLYFNYINDNVASVREVGIKSLKLLAEKFGSSWIISNLIPKLQSYLTTQKISYLTRMCILHSACICAPLLDAKQNNDYIVSILQRGFKDKIPNVRFYAIKLTKDIIANLDGAVKDKLLSSVKSLMTDDDQDVKYFATKFCEMK